MYYAPNPHPSTVAQARQADTQPQQQPTQPTMQRQTSGERFHLETGSDFEQQQQQQTQPPAFGYSQPTTTTTTAPADANGALEIAAVSAPTATDV